MLQVFKKIWNVKKTPTKSHAIFYVVPLKSELVVDEEVLWSGRTCFCSAVERV